MQQNGGSDTYVLEAGVADALAANATLLPQNFGTNYLDYYWKKFGTGLGTTASPALGWESRIPYGQELHGTNNIVYGVTNTANGFGASNSATQNFTQIYGHGATLKYWGTGLAPWLVSFNAGTAAQTGLSYCHFEGFKLDCRGSTNTNQATGALLMLSSHHMTVQDVQVIGAGTNALNAVQVAGCTDSALIDVDVIGGAGNNPSCSNFAHHYVFSGVLNTFYSAYFPNTVGVFKIYSSTAANSGVVVESTFGSKFFGVSENSITGYGLEVGTNTSTLNFTMDFEGSGPPTGIVGVHQAVWLQTGTALNAPRQITFDNSTAFDGAFRIDANVTGLTIKGGTWAGATNNSSAGITVDSAQGLDPAGNWQGITAGVAFLNRAGNGPNIQPEGYWGGTNGLQLDQGAFGHPSIFHPADFANRGTRYFCVINNGAGAVNVVGGAAGLDLTVANNTVEQIRAGGVTFNQPVVAGVLTYTTLNGFSTPGAAGGIATLDANGLLTAAQAGFTFTQAVAAASWVVVHNLGRHPSVTVEDSTGKIGLATVHYDSNSQVTITFAGATSGKAYLI